MTGNVVTSKVGQDWSTHVIADVRTDEDARLIREAPVLLEVSEFFVGILDTLQNSGILRQLDAIGVVSDGVLLMQEQARAAIAWAKGEPHG